jgi:hypothetical protein
LKIVDLQHTTIYHPNKLLLIIISYKLPFTYNGLPILQTTRHSSTFRLRGSCVFDVLNRTRKRPLHISCIPQLRNNILFPYALNIFLSWKTCCRSYNEYWVVYFHIVLIVFILLYNLLWNTKMYYICVLIISFKTQPHQWCNVSVAVVSSAPNRGIEPRSGQTKDYNIGMCCFSAKHASLRRKNKDWLARNLLLKYCW